MQLSNTMTYRVSHVDRQNFGWFGDDVTRATLLRIRIVTGEIRGIADLDVEFRYPITAIAGVNGSGKTTILALAACAFHGSRDGYMPRGRSQTYYTFSDFFVQTADEVPVEGVSIVFQIRYNRWRRRESAPDAVGDRWQERRKKRGGRWNHYDLRVRRPVVYMGINRLVPHAEKSTSKSYRTLFSRAAAAGWEDELCTRVGRILGRRYRDFEFRKHSRYRLAVVRFGRRTYSGFNMGAGEDGLFELVSTCLDCPPGSLLIIDELELGLHEDAQARLVAELKELCNERKLQIICTTHSGRVLEALPPEGRIFVEREGNAIRTTVGISAKLATGRLAGRPEVELVVLVEDSVSKALLEAPLDADTRSRVRVVAAGSKVAVLRHLATHYCEGHYDSACAILDGDAADGRDDLERQFCGLLEARETDEARIWFRERVAFLPGGVPPEDWMFAQRGPELSQRLQAEFNMRADEVDGSLEAAVAAEAHDRLFELAHHLFVEDLDLVLYQMSKGALECCPEEARRMLGFLRGCLP